MGIGQKDYTTVQTIKGTVGATSELIVPKGTFMNTILINNRSDTDNLIVSFGIDAVAAEDFQIPPEQALTLYFGVASDIYAVSSGGDINYVAIGY